jgi:hypothetical protein
MLAILRRAAVASIRLQRGLNAPRAPRGVVDVAVSDLQALLVIRPVASRHVDCEQDVRADTDALLTVVLDSGE